MSDVLSELIELLALEPLGEDRYIGGSQDLGWGTIFGGQVLGQALSAAAQTVDSKRVVHSMHGYFLRTGDVSASVEYEVDRLRDGRSFTTRRVVARQHGKAIFSLAASFHADEVGFEHQDPMPAVTPPEKLVSERTMARAVADQIPDWLKGRALNPRPVETRPVNPINPMRPDVRPGERMVWYRASRALPDDPALHRYLLAYISDFNFLAVALQPHGVSWLSKGIRMASLDHAIWFHRPFRLDDWLLHVVESPSAAGARGMVRGRIYTVDGTLVATTAQEGVIRMSQWREGEAPKSGGPDEEGK